MRSPLPASFYARDARSVARELLGAHVTANGVTLKLTELEAYCGPTDSAAHARFGLTARTRSLFGPAGRAYVYLCYGIHWMLNVVVLGDGSAILVRAAEPVDGLALIRARRGLRDGVGLLNGPGKVAQALALERRHDGLELFRPEGEIVLSAPDPAPVKILRGPRVGIDYASPRHRRALWRFALAGTPWVSRPETLRAR